jgi:hypothetical protein
MTAVTFGEVIWCGQKWGLKHSAWWTAIGFLMHGVQGSFTKTFSVSLCSHL